MQTERPDLVIADILMPTMDGYEFVRQLRADPAVAATPVIFLTAHYHEREAQSLARACGVSRVLIKPCEPEVVLGTVDSVLGSVPVAAPAPSAEDFDREHLRVLTDKLSQKADQLRKANARLTALVELGLDLGSERDPQQLLQSFCHRAREIVGARYAVVGVLDGDGLALRYCVTSGMNTVAAARLGSPDPRQGVLGTILRECRCLRLQRPDGPDPESPFAPCQSFLGAPMVSPARVYGWLCLLDKVGAEEFSAEDERLAGILAAQVGRTYENGSLYADVLSHAAEMEREVGERKRAEEALREREEHIRLLLDSTAEAIYGIDRRGRCTFCNLACVRLLGYLDAGQLLGKNMHELMHHTRADGTPYPVKECRIFQAFRKGEGTHVEDEVFWRADGSSFPAEYWSYPIRHKGQIVGSVVTFLDITERKRLEDQYRQARQRLEEVIAANPAVLFTLGIEGERIQGISWISDNLRGLLGYTPEEALAPEWWTERIHPEDRDRIIGQTHEDLFSQGASSHEYRFRHQDGNYRWTRGEIRLIRDAAGRPKEAVGSWSDITERKQLEDQFRQAQKMEAVGRLAGGIAHDFNNLLTVINGYGELLLAELPAADPSRELIREIAAAGDRAKALTRQLLAFSRRAIIEPKVLDLKAVVADIDKMLRRIIGEDIQLTVAADPESGAVKADAGQMEQVILNLVVNARDAMPQGGRLTIEVRNAELDESYVRDHVEARVGAHVLLAVSDTGCGMDAATMARVFEPFFSTKGEQGTGLGLATVHGIVKQAGGHVAVYSEVGHGTTFKVYLPRVQQRPPEGKAQPGSAVMPRGSETLMLAEDEDGVRALTRRVLQACGYTLLEARDGAEAVRIAEQHQGRIDLLITDVVMPRMGGREVAERLMALQPGIRVLFLSGYTNDAVVRHGILEAEVAFLQKPFSATALAAKVRKVLDGK